MPRTLFRMLPLLFVSSSFAFSQTPQITLLQDNSQAEDGAPFSCAVNLDILNSTGERIAVVYTITPETATDNGIDHTPPASLAAYIAYGGATASLGPVVITEKNLFERDETFYANGLSAPSSLIFSHSNGDGYCRIAVVLEQEVHK